MPYQNAITQLDGLAAIRAVSATFQRIDPRLMEHGERVAFLACELREEGGLPLDEKTLFLLCIFHDMGAYKTDEIDRMVEFETSNVRDHSVYGYLFAKYMSPLRDKAEALLYHHASWDELRDAADGVRDYAALIHLCDRVDIASLGSEKARLPALLTERVPPLFSPDYAALFARCFRRRRLLERLADGSYHEDNARRVRAYEISPETALEYVKMLVYAIDFRSEHTVTHTINTVSLALNAAKHMGLDEAAQERIYLGALLHDVGKIAIPARILEYPGRLNAGQMTVMRTHVLETERIIRHIVPDDVCRIAVRHHEKLDGSGYPRGLTGAELDMSQRIVAVADIVSALCSRRSYKEPFPKEMTVRILNELGGTKLDGTVCAYIRDNYDAIMAETDVRRSAVIAAYQAIRDEFQNY